MSLIGSYRQSGLIAKGTNAGASGSASIINFTGFKPSDGNLHRYVIVYRNYIPPLLQ